MESLEDEFITVRELSEHWRVSIRTVRLYISDGAVAVIRLRGRVFVSWREVWRHEQRSRPGPRCETARKRPLLTVDEAAALTRYRPGYLYALAARGEIPTCRVFGNLRFIDTDLRAWMRAPLPCRTQTPCEDNDRELPEEHHDVD
jgi:excisionase family DNA binding protein